MKHRDLLGLLRISHRRCSVKKDVLKKFANFTGKRLCWSLFLIKLQAKLQHWCFPVKFAKSLRTSILKNICERLLLQWRVWTRRDLDRVQSKYFFLKHNNFIRSNVAISFIHKIKKCFFNISVDILIIFDFALLKYSILHQVS